VCHHCGSVGSGDGDGSGTAVLLLASLLCGLVVCVADVVADVL